jgi:hypothetical protein
MMAATTAVGTASGARAWVGARFADRLGPVAMRALTVALLGLAVIAAGLGLGGTG